MPGGADPAGNQAAGVGGSRADLIVQLYGHAAGLGEQQLMAPVLMRPESCQPRAAAIPMALPLCWSGSKGDRGRIRPYVRFLMFIVLLYCNRTSVITLEWRPLVKGVS